MQDFPNPLEFENALIEVADSILSKNAVVRRHQTIGRGTSMWELDYVFEPLVASADGRMYIFEFKYSSSPTLADSIIFTQFARFSALGQANRRRKLSFLLVTNGSVPENLQTPDSVVILDQVQTKQVWRKKLTHWLEDELPDFRVPLPPVA